MESRGPRLGRFVLIGAAVCAVVVAGAFFAMGAGASAQSGSAGRDGGAGQTTDQALGLGLNLSVVLSSGTSGSTFHVNATVTNLLARVNNVTGKDDYSGVQFNPICNVGPVTFEVLAGYFTAGNFSSGKVVTIHGVQNMMCVVSTSDLPYYVFKPGSDVFSGPLPGGDAQLTRAATVSADLSLAWSSDLTSPAPFAPGLYTVVAADNWGQVAVAHFTVS